MHIKAIATDVCLIKARARFGPRVPHIKVLKLAVFNIESRSSIDVFITESGS